MSSIDVHALRTELDRIHGDLEARVSELQEHLHLIQMGIRGARERTERLCAVAAEAVARAEGRR